MNKVRSSSPFINFIRAYKHSQWKWPKSFNGVGGIVVLLIIHLHCAPSARYSAGYIEDKQSPENITRGHIFYGEASYYANDFHGKKTANGEIFDMYKISAAHKTLPFNTLLKVTNLGNLRTVVVRINDRGPFKKGRVLDLSYMAAKEIDMLSNGVAKIKAEIIRVGE